nr:cytosolic sulfotransferase 17-like [Ipomoea batatas]
MQLYKSENEAQPSSFLIKQTKLGDETLDQINGFWFLPEHVSGVKRVLNEFEPRQDDVILASLPKTGTTCLKSLVYSIVNRSSLGSLEHNPHDLVPFLELQVYKEKESPKRLENNNAQFGNGRRIFGTHIPYQMLGTTLETSDCRVVYVTRNPKDTLNWMWHFENEQKKDEEEAWPLEEAVGNFCKGIFPFGPYYEHVLGYKNASLKNRGKVLFITYEELAKNTETHVKKLAEFLGCPFESEENEKVAEIVKSCSFEVLKNHTMNKSEDPISDSRQATSGDYKNYLNLQAIGRVNSLTREKFHTYGFMYGI